jgi:hypothetical protein
MANQPENPIWEVGVYQFETTDPIEGGVGGIDNLPLLQLANRTSWLKANVWRTGDIKEVDCSNAYIVANFDSTGLGMNERLGWAICNGQNGTKDRNGRVGVAWGDIYPTMGATFGSKDAVIVKHKHASIRYSNGESAVNDLGTGGLASGYPEISAPNGTGSINETSETGVTGTDKNMQPSIVSLFIQKL